MYLFEYTPLIDDVRMDGCLVASRWVAVEVPIGCWAGRMAGDVCAVLQARRGRWYGVGKGRRGGRGGKEDILTNINYVYFFEARLFYEAGTVKVFLRGVCLGGRG